MFQLPLVLCLMLSHQGLGSLDMVSSPRQDSHCFEGFQSVDSTSLTGNSLELLLMFESNTETFEMGALFEGELDLPYRFQIGSVWVGGVLEQGSTMNLPHCQ